MFDSVKELLSNEDEDSKEKIEKNEDVVQTENNDAIEIIENSEETVAKDTGDVLDNADILKEINELEKTEVQKNVIEFENESIEKSSDLNDLYEAEESVDSEKTSIIDSSKLVLEVVNGEKPELDTEEQIVDKTKAVLEEVKLDIEDVTEKEKEDNSESVATDNLEAIYEKEKKQKIVLIIVSAVIVLLLAVYLCGVAYFKKHFGTKTVIDSVDCSYMTVTEVESIIADQVSKCSLTIIERDNKKETINVVDAGVEYVSDGQVTKLLDKQNEWRWPERFFYDSASKDNTEISVQINDEKFKKVIESLTCLDEDKMVLPEDAELFFNGTVYEIIPEVVGNKINNRKNAVDKIKKSLLGLKEELNLETEQLYENPQYTSNSSELVELANTYNEILGLNITYRINGRKEVLDGSVINGWVSWNENMEPIIDTEAIKQWVSNFALRYNTVGKNRTVTNPAGLTFSVSGGSYGWSINQNAEVDMILQMFEEKKSQDREPIWSQRGTVYGEQDFGNTYIEINISSQHVTYWNNGSAALSTDVITGNPNKGMSTPCGVWTILEMKRNKIMRGDIMPDGSYEYETPAAYWMRVTWSGVGLHDCTWHAVFGGTIYQENGSHGCINMPPDMAAALYGMIYVGMPVVIHY